VPPPAVAPLPLLPTPTPSPAPPLTQAKPRSAGAIKLEKAIRSILKQENFELYPIVAKALLAAAAKDPHIRPILGAVTNGRVTSQQQRYSDDFVKVVETKCVWAKQGGPW
jgi:hypothetical protein